MVGMGFGDEGKGSVVDYLVREHDARLVVRFNGGAQAAHSVLTPEGQQHTFRQFGSGTLAGASTHLSRHTLVDPVALVLEAEELRADGLDRDPLSAVTVDPHAAVTTPFHRALNRLRELARGSQRHGSCGFGIAETVRDVIAGRALRYADLREPGLYHRLHRIQIRLLAEAARFGRNVDIQALGEADRLLWVDATRALIESDEVEATREIFETIAARVPALPLESLDTSGTVVYEGAQGALLDEVHGFAPFNTWSTCTAANAVGLAGLTGAEPMVIGVLRGYLTRHGEGPFPTEAELGFTDERNPTNPWQGELRYGWPDLVLAAYAGRWSPVDELAITCMDHLHQLDVEALPVAVRWEMDRSRLPEASGDVTDAMTRSVYAARPVYESMPVGAFLEALQEAAAAPVTLFSEGPTANEKTTVAASAAVR